MKNIFNNGEAENDENMPINNENSAPLPALPFPPHFSSPHTNVACTSLKRSHAPRHNKSILLPTITLSNSYIEEHAQTPCTEHHQPSLKTKETKGPSIPSRSSQLGTYNSTVIVSSTQLPFTHISNGTWQWKHGWSCPQSYLNLSLWAQTDKCPC